MVSFSFLLRRIHYWVRIAASSEISKVVPTFNMGKKHKNLFQKIISDENMEVAFYKAAKSNRRNEGYLRFAANKYANLDRLQQELASLEYKPGEPFVFPVHEPKYRMVTELPFRDRVAEHAVCNVIEPIFDRVFLPQSYACRKGKGTHKAARDVQAALRRDEKNDLKSHTLKTDWYQYFPSVIRALIHKEFRRKISCWATLRLLEIMLPFQGVGIAIGRLVSQLAANIKGHIVDRWLVHTVGVTRFFRYMDDIVFLGYSKEALAVLMMRLEAFAKAHLGLSYSHWYLKKGSAGVNFVGYRIWATHKLLRKDSVIRAKRKLKRLDGEDRERFLASWLGHAGHADTHNLLKRMELV